MRRRPNLARGPGFADRCSLDYAKHQQYNTRLCSSTLSVGCCTYIVASDHHLVAVPELSQQTAHVRHRYRRVLHAPQSRDAMLGGAEKLLHVNCETQPTAIQVRRQPVTEGSGSYFLQKSDHLFKCLYTLSLITSIPSMFLFVFSTFLLYMPCIHLPSKFLYLNDTLLTLRYACEINELILIVNFSPVL